MKGADNMKKIYLLFSRTGTIPSRLIHGFLGGKFTHISIALTPDTDKFYSFARRTLHNPFNAGFYIESIHTHVFAKYPDCNCAVYSLEIDDESYEKLQKMIDDFVLNKELFDYNFLGLLPAKLGIKTSRRYHFTCSQFVATVLQKVRSIELPKHPSLMMPNDFLKISGIKSVYSGKIKNCKIKAY